MQNKTTIQDSGVLDGGGLIIPTGLFWEQCGSSLGIQTLNATPPQYCRTSTFAQTMMKHERKKERKKDHLKHTPTKKPRTNNNVRMQLKAWAAALRSRDKETYKKERAHLYSSINAVEMELKKSLFRIISERTTHAPCGRASKLSRITNSPSDTSPLDKLNTFFACFEENPRLQSYELMTTSYSDQSLTLQHYRVKRALRHINTKKAPGPDGVTGQVLKACANQLAVVFDPRPTSFFLQAK